jgi:hypothetical protein
MYLDFPEGRLKLFGTLVFPRAKFMALRVGGGAAVMAEDVFENLVRPLPGPSLDRVRILSLMKAVLSPRLAGTLP